MAVDGGVAWRGATSLGAVALEGRAARPGRATRAAVGVLARLREEGRAEALCREPCAARAASAA